MKIPLNVNSLTLLGILLIPFMSFPIMPTNYRPISVFFLFITGVVYFYTYLLKLKISKDVLILSIFVIFSTIHSFFLVELSQSLRALFPLWLGFFSYVAMLQFLKNTNIEKVFRFFLKLYIFIILISIIEILSMKGVLPFELKQLIGTIFSGHVNKRIQLITSEASWAAKIIIFVIPIYFYFYNKYGKIYKSFFILLIIFIFLFSLEGFLIIMCSILLYAIFDFKHIFRKLIYFYKKYSLSLRNIKIITSLFMLIILFGIVLNVILSTEQNYAISRVYKIIENFNINSLLFIISLDESTFIRAIYPYIGLLIFFHHPLGIGLGGYPEYFNFYINQLPINFSSFKEVSGDIETVSADPKNLYSKILSETGIIGSFLFLVFLTLHIKYLSFIKRMNPNFRLFFISNFLLGICGVLQFGSLAYLPFWFSLAINGAIFYKLKRGDSI